MLFITFKMVDFHDMSNSSFNDSKESNEISEAECDRDHGPRGNYGGKLAT